MATTGIWKIEKRLDNVLDYTTNVEKNAVVSPVQPPVQAPSPVQAPPVVIDSSSITINNQ